MSAAAIYACHRQYREAKTALGKLVPTVHEYQSDFYKQFHRQYHRLGIGISRLFSGQSVSRITQADGSRAILEPQISSSKVILQLHRDYFLSARTHYNMNFVLNLQYVFGPNTAPAQECSPTEYFEYRDVWSIQLQRMSDLKSISHYLQLVFVIYL
ncbi:Hypothetical_protein [Hexamita inflata]|uniref:Hypothetical_protein n=1 Tax=Hexamita inflata TaxID=28002 RepID=A0ABP1J511_9EUKA